MPAARQRGQAPPGHLGIRVLDAHDDPDHPGVDDRLDAEAASARGASRAAERA